MSICYDIAGRVDTTLQRCNTTSNITHSACCAINKTYPDICLESGLCLATDPYHMGFVYENGCTDSTGTDRACPYLCPQLHNDFSVKTAEIFHCKPGKWCCRAGASSTNCCDDNATQLDAGHIGNITTPMLEAIRRTSASRSVASVENNSTTGSTASNDTTDPTCDADSAMAPIVGGILGGFLFAALVGLATVIWLWRRERRERRALLKEGEGTPMAAGTVQNFSQELEGELGLVEADAMHQTLELPLRAHE